MTMNSSPAMPSQTQWLSSGSKTRIRWKIPEKILEDAEQDREHVQRARRVEAHDDAEDQG